MEEEYEGEAPVLPSKPRVRHIKKRALKNKALSVSFNEKDLRDYVTGFHKRKKKRRKEAQKKQEQAERRKRIERRKKRKLEKEFALYGGVLPGTGSEPDGVDENKEDDEEREPTASLSGTTKYDGENMTVTVIMSEISREEEEDSTGERTQMAMPRSVGDKVDRKQALSVSKSKPFKKVAKHRSKPPSKRDRNKGGKRNKNRH
ncbi:hypothetical protein F3Y22_tig00116962pilonHSYRG00967 [Hibiscus syriacus]|uniref:Ribosomal RNA-processing protein 17 n=1 Tax=Hibiscus syriacus TaxID=106335 RepID=A0A6A2WJK2_HIBSY|nr:ribosomal RNA-processing protein 17-like [Hibiscus syriacus]KAE8659732.1 hypothetical protein F3Y22_tig00116962pilonHSYRG00967 [Hibiscus syriacus]